MSKLAEKQTPSAELKKSVSGVDKTVVIAQILEDYPGIVQARAQYLCELHNYDYKKIKSYLGSENEFVINTKQGSSLEDFYKSHKSKIAEKANEGREDIKETDITDKPEEKKVQKQRPKKKLKKIPKVGKSSHCGCSVL
eukprot:TRINITY_DN13771_c0_g2_i5.p1 TRINITY_DN13771_c0_g2~~TRINITY_DN13771_c0_g2_i5.p1  ORF type:complete len:139 (+),score=45.79 TRINITY_DN13771_c0_g2_i5:432-848(+)